MSGRKQEGASISHRIPGVDSLEILVACRARFRMPVCMKPMHLPRLALLYSILGLSLVLSACKTTEDRLIVGETAFITIEEIDAILEARIDTGARTTSVHALDVVIDGDEGDFEKNIGKVISFNVVNAAGERFPVKSTIGGYTVVRNAQGTESRYHVPMTLSWEGVRKEIEVNLRDRSAMTYKLLIGRDWLSDDFLVNVDIADEAGE